MTHKDLVNAAFCWVFKNASCGVAFKEFVATTTTGEIPDVIGFGSCGRSILIECKMSRADFLADKKKVFRIDPSQGMGSYRFYCCPEGLLKKEDMPEKWGLLWVNDAFKAKCIHKPYKGYIGYWESFQKNIKAEHELMYSALRRLQLKGQIEEIYEKRDN